MERLVVDAKDVGAGSYRGWIYRGFTLRAGQGQLIAVAGRGGSGRTSVLLTLGGRMRPAEGTLQVCGLLLPERAASVRSQVAMARIGGAAELEDALRVRDHVRERAVSSGVGMPAFGDACAAVGASFDVGAHVGSLSPPVVTLLALTLGAMTGKNVLLLDDLDAGADGVRQRLLWAAARRVADRGTCVVASTLDSSAAEGAADQVVAL